MLLGWIVTATPFGEVPPPPACALPPPPACALPPVPPPPACALPPVPPPPACALPPVPPPPAVLLTPLLPPALVLVPGFLSAPHATVSEPTNRGTAIFMESIRIPFEPGSIQQTDGRWRARRKCAGRISPWFQARSTEKWPMPSHGAWSSGRNRTGFSSRPSTPSYPGRELRLRQLFERPHPQKTVGDANLDVVLGDEFTPSEQAHRAGHVLGNKMLTGSFVVPCSRWRTSTSS
jgi:hypothetical protein